MKPVLHSGIVRHKQRRVSSLLSTASRDWCVAELRDKAKAWEETGRMVIFNTTTVCQSDVLPLQPNIQQEVARLWQQTGTPVSGTAAAWSHIMDPSLFPLIYGRTPVLANGGTVRLEDPWSTKKQQPAS